MAQCVGNEANKEMNRWERARSREAGRRQNGYDSDAKRASGPAHGLATAHPAVLVTEAVTARIGIERQCRRSEGSGEKRWRRRGRWGQL
mmetsp:Transcript_13943/g.34055  ORF Transcript_13943/g.34055 Transcript_13943/m.34055 type:complete len:89 (+) Transcript_13943:1488-1754(+)